MKLLIITDAWQPQVNGVVRTYENLIQEIEKMGHVVKVISPNDFKYTMPMPGYAEIQLTLFPARPLAAMIEAFAPDAVHLPTEGPLGTAGRRYCLKHGRFFTTSYHTHFPDYFAKRMAKYLPLLHKPAHALAKKFVRNFHAPSSAMMVATQSLEDDLIAWGFKNPMNRVTRGAHLDQFFPGEKTLFNDIKRPVALCVGRVAIEKNIEKFLEMDWDGSKVIVGDGPSLKALQAQHPDALFVGKKIGKELAEHYRSADIFAFPSRTDTFGIVLIEALASGLPIAAYNVTGPKDIITEPLLGALDDNDNLAAAAQQALNAPGSAQERAAHVKNYYTWDNAARQFFGKIAALVKEKA